MDVAPAPVVVPLLPQTFAVHGGGVPHDAEALAAELSGCQLNAGPYSSKGGGGGAAPLPVPAQGTAPLAGSGFFLMPHDYSSVDSVDFHSEALSSSTHHTHASLPLDTCLSNTISNSGAHSVFSMASLSGPLSSNSCAVHSTSATDTSKPDSSELVGCWSMSSKYSSQQQHQKSEGAHLSSHSHAHQHQHQQHSQTASPPPLPFPTSTTTQCQGNQRRNQGYRKLFQQVGVRVPAPVRSHVSVPIW